VKTGATQKGYFMKNKYIISICTEVYAKINFVDFIPPPFQLSHPPASTLVATTFYQQMVRSPAVMLQKAP
jgi:hypothetical protein